MQRCIIIGASHGGAQVSTSLRQHGWKGEIVLVGEEKWLPYHRPPLSKSFLSEDKTIDDILIRPSEAYTNANITTLLGRRAIHIDPISRQVTLNDSTVLDASHIVIATGGQARRLAIPGAELDGVNVLRNAEDVAAIREVGKPGARAVIIGGGYIGLETAASLRALGASVTLLEAEERVLARVTSAAMSAFYQRVHTEEGVDIVTNARVSAIVGADSVSAVELADGRRIAADLVIIGVGIIPSTDLAKAAGLKIDNGIVVNQYAETSAQNIYAVGDCAMHFNPFYERWLRLESIQNTVDQAKIAASAICGNPKTYEALPWFWSDQYDIKLQIAGLSQGYEKIIIRGDLVKSRSVAAFYMRGGRLIACDAINRPLEFMVTKRLLTNKTPVSEHQLRDESFDLKTLL